MKYDVQSYITNRLVKYDLVKELALIFPIYSFNNYLSGMGRIDEWVKSSENRVEETRTIPIPLSQL